LKDFEVTLQAVRTILRWNLQVETELLEVEDHHAWVTATVTIAALMRREDDSVQSATDQAMPLFITFPKKARNSTPGESWHVCASMLQSLHNFHQLHLLKLGDLGLESLLLECSVILIRTLALDQDREGLLNVLEDKKLLQWKSFHERRAAELVRGANAAAVAAPSSSTSASLPAPSVTTASLTSRLTLPYLKGTLCFFRFLLADVQTRRDSAKDAAQRPGKFSKIVWQILVALIYLAIDTVDQSELNNLVATDILSLLEAFPGAMKRAGSREVASHYLEFLQKLPKSTRDSLMNLNSNSAKLVVAFSSGNTE
jgi:hypothetical protein